LGQKQKSDWYPRVSTAGKKVRTIAVFLLGDRNSIRPEYNESLLSQLKPMTTTHEITALLLAWSNGDSEALEKLVPLVDRELRRLAHSFMSKERAGHTLQTTALVNEALMRLIEADKIDWQGRVHFYAIVARRMRQLLIENARGQLALKRGERAEHVNLSAAGPISTEKSEELLMLDAALRKLAELDERKSKIVEYRYFGGFTIEEVAGMLDVSESTVEGEWRLARSWLRREMTGDTNSLQEVTENYPRNAAK
jgi:RNA polymerase sigma factor (TIGR02999 family)